MNGWDTEIKKRKISSRMPKRISLYHAGRMELLEDTPEIRRQIFREQKALNEIYQAARKNAAVLLENTDDRDRKIIFSRDTTGGVYRLSYFDKYGAIRHKAADTIKEIIGELRFGGWEGYEMIEIMPK